ncbi:XapX domain-containing protein [Rhizobium mesosinicum]|uniref:XapX domain-containing protein n=1 Tax=Rhizobium mesosinicum TaxID=335017 RepID=A0ABS7GN22_9HYPH|nr:XapX domain-containing protein [Rhizobium mesosinicum]MBW9051056.1 XapX domain-containing protein [Rhizobium mesosinicum]
MRVYLLSLAVGVLVGCIYGVLNVRSPAPPVIALVGLLGILVGEQIPPLVLAFAAHPSPVSWWDQISSHMFGQMPDGQGGTTEKTNNDSNSGE